METLRTKEFPIEVELNGKPNSDITLSDPMLSAETVIVSALHLWCGRLRR